ncbi:adenosine deaminase [Litorihabitans aurantiacus]|uniref:Adenosine deaminase n=1 Tax=Litorihabitans aurantiacus TaxID=1930061 RepID=A0AA37XGB5_9MICO|nr:adenosine deaminase [Litorihabitans aurantiacus]GMA32315.1 adenosine deaminase [Litorihabitans aurantiacus]
MRDLAALPKAHLHLHFTGSMRPATLAELAEAQGVRVPAALLDGVPDVPADVRGWFRFQRLYEAARAVVRTEGAMRRVLREAVEDDAAEGSRRLEIQVDPTSYAPHVGGLVPALEIVLDEARAAQDATGVSVGVVVAASRMRHPMEARTLARLAARYAGDGPGRVVGFGLSNDERRGDTEQFAPAFAIAARAGLPGVPHGGELLGPGHVRDVVTHLHPRRLGHGVRASEDPALLAELAAAGVACEVCPASNVSLGVYRESRQVPLATLLAAGVPVALGADDPLLFGTRLVAQYDAARAVHGLDDTALAGLARDSVSASLAPEADRRRWLGEIDAWVGGATVPGGAPAAAAAAR